VLFVRMPGGRGVLKAALKGERGGLGDASLALSSASEIPLQDDIVSTPVMGKLPGCKGGWS
jgi:hypothetical protein